MIIEFFYDKDQYKIFDEKLVKKWLSNSARGEKKVIGKIQYSFVSDENILELNREFLNHDYYTDIITFDSSLVNIINGEIFISFDTVLTNAEELGIKVLDELYRVIIHGLMHLVGYKDSSEDEKKLMRLKENTYLGYLEKL